jgi:hypothetical protein
MEGILEGYHNFALIDISHFGMRKHCPRCEELTQEPITCDLCGFVIENIEYQFNKVEAEIELDDLICDIQYELQSAFALDACNRRQYEVTVFLENNYVEVGYYAKKFSEYYSTFIVSVAKKQDTDIPEIAQAYTEYIGTFIEKNYIKRKAS